MGVAGIKPDYKLNHVIEQLQEIGQKVNGDETYAELVRKLAIARAMEVEVSNPGGGWF